MTTALNVKGQRMYFMTIPQEKGCDIEVRLANEKFEVYGNASISISEKDEITYHTELRKEANDRGQFVKEYSTNTELNPL